MTEPSRSFDHAHADQYSSDIGGGPSAIFHGNPHRLQPPTTLKLNSEALQKAKYLRIPFWFTFSRLLAVLTVTNN